MKMRKGPVVRSVVLVLLLVCSLAACGDDDGGEASGGGGEDITTVRVGTFPGTGTGNWATGIAQELGYFEREGLDVEITYTYDGGALLAGGQLDMISDGGDTGVIAAAQGADVIAIAPVVMLSADGLISQPELDSVDDLAGTTLRVTNQGTDEFLARQFIEAEGLDPEEVTWASIDEDGPAIAQLEAGQIDGGMFSGDVIQAASETGDYNVLAAPADFGPFPWNLLQTTRSFAEENHDATVGYVRAMRDAIEFITDPANEDEVVDALVSVQEEIGREEMAASYRLAASSDFDMFSLEGLTPEDVQPVVDQLLFFDFADGNVGEVDLNEFIDNSYADEAAGR
jgi:NitT/TauT family transport system substrate-binding protein